MKLCSRSYREGCTAKQKVVFWFESIHSFDLSVLKRVFFQCPFFAFASGKL